MRFVEVTKVSEVPAGTMKHIETGGKFYAIGDRCGHENARMSTGNLSGTVITCPMHFSRFDVTTGKLLSGPKLEMSGAVKMFAKCPEDVQKEVAQMFGRIAENQSLIKTYDQPVYEVKVEGNIVRVQL